MNNVSFDKNVKSHANNRAGMIRSYRTTRTFVEILALVFDMILYGFDRMLDVLARPALCRVLRGSIAITCLLSFFFLIGAIEQNTFSLAIAIPIALVLMIIEVLCLRGK